MDNNSQAVIHCTASIVLYKNDVVVLKKAVDSVLRSNSVSVLYLIDNSPTNDLKILFELNKIVYIHNPSNPGFGAAHNIAINRSIFDGFKYHFVINPDIFYFGDVIKSMLEYMDTYTNIGMMMPQILNLDNTIQTLPKLIPAPADVLMRKLKKPARYYEKFIDNYELRLAPADKIYHAPILSGCFTLLKLSAVKDIGGYDDSFFMYFEDWDLSRRMNQKYDTIYFPKVSVFHEYHSGANKNYKLFNIFIKSAITYFNKWGWFFDDDRRKINKKTLAQFEV